MASPAKNIKSNRLLILVFWLLVGIFILIMGIITIEKFRDFLFSKIPGHTLFPLILALMFILSLALIFLALKRKSQKTLKKFLLLTGFSVAGFAILTALHNAFSALNIITSQFAILNYIMEAFQVTFFLVAIFICPLGFLIGLAGSIFSFIKLEK